MLDTTGKTIRRQTWSQTTINNTTFSKRSSVDRGTMQPEMGWTVRLGRLGRRLLGYGLDSSSSRAIQVSARQSWGTDYWGLTTGDWGLLTLHIHRPGTYDVLVLRGRGTRFGSAHGGRPPTTERSRGQKAGKKTRQRDREHMQDDKRVQCQGTTAGHIDDKRVGQKRGKARGRKSKWTINTKVPHLHMYK